MGRGQPKVLKTVTYDNPETGEQVIKQSLVDMQFSYSKGYMFRKQQNCIRTFFDKPLPDGFTWAERGRIEALKRFILADNQFLVYRSDNIIKPITKYELCKIFEMSERQCKSLIKKIKKYGVVKEVKFNDSVYFCFNPLYGIKDKRITLTTYIIFQDELKTSLPQWVVNNFVHQAEEIKPNIEIIK